jgi:hypothetical protein
MGGHIGAGMQSGIIYMIAARFNAAQGAAEGLASAKGK